ncbi:NADP-dependent oxidoreductase [Nocardia brasiliensis]|uniref:NADP-dependent oxidoreductase n=1 Tax=Nocardia brasiliensis TaxID=37326 RepID=UPI003D89C76E
MRTIRYEEFGAPDVLRLVDIDVPAVGPNQIRVAVTAAGVNPFDWHLRSGARRFPGLKPPIRPGLEVAGVVDGLGPGVSDVSIGDPVLGWTALSLADSGGYADFALCDGWTRKPDGLDWAAAAALPVAVQTADTVLRRLALRAGEMLLINGASGSVGSMAAQLARSSDVSVIGTAAERNRELLHEIGVVAVAHGPGLVASIRASAPRGIDAVFDAAGHDFLSAAIELRGGTDRIVTIADPSGPDMGVELSRSVAVPRPVALLATVAAAIVTGRYRLPAPPRQFPLADAAEAHAAGEYETGRGKIVLRTDAHLGAV